MVAQHNFYSFDFPVLDVVLMGRSPHKKLLERDNLRDYELARKALGVVGMAAFEERSFSSLSGGEQQRVILARALAQQTECMILDEPTNHLDIKYQLQIMDIVKGLGLTVAAAIHDLNIAALYCELLPEEFIYDLYEVRSTVSIHPDTGRLNIVYLPQYEEHP